MRLRTKLIFSFVLLAVIPLAGITLGRPLGLGLGGGFEERQVRVSEGDYLFFYTDGLTDAEDPHGEEFGTARLERLLLAECQSGFEAILARVEAATKEHLAGRDAPDDATMMLVSIGA